MPVYPAMPRGVSVTCTLQDGNIYVPTGQVAAPKLPIRPQTAKGREDLMVNMSNGKFVTLGVGGAQVKTHYHEAGAAGRDAVLFVKTGGAATTAYMCWYLNMPAFAEGGYHVFAPDTIGSGFTEIVSKEPGRVDSSEFILAFMEAVGVEQAHFIGNSAGSQASVRFAVEHPERVKSLILSGGEPRVQTIESGAIAKTLGRTPRMDFVREMLSKPEVNFQDMRKATADFFYDAEHPVIDGVTTMRLDMINRPGVREIERDGAFQQIQGGRTNHDAAYLAQIQAPTYLLHGRDERFFFTEDIAPTLLDSAMKVALAIPNCSCTVLAQCGHWPQLEKADTYNTLCLNFLSTINSTT